MHGTAIPFYFGLGSRYSYLAASQIDGIEERTGCRFEWLPLQSGELIRRANKGLSPFHGDRRSGQYDWIWRQSDAESWADYYGITYREPAEFRVDPPDLAKACWAADIQGSLKPMSRRLFQAIFVEGLVVTADVMRRCASETGIDEAAFAAALVAPETAARHDAVLERAVADGAFGVPSFVFGGRLFWGNDRLVLLEHTLANSPAVKG